MRKKNPTAYQNQLPRDWGKLRSRRWGVSRKGVGGVFFSSGIGAMVAGIVVYRNCADLIHREGREGTKRFLVDLDNSAVDPELVFIQKKIWIKSHRPKQFGFTSASSC